MTKQQLEAVIAKQQELIGKLQSMVDSGQDYDREYHEIWVELQALKGKLSNRQSVNAQSTPIGKEPQYITNARKSQDLQSIKQEEEPRKESWRDFTMTDKTKAMEKFKIYIDQKPFETELQFITGAQLKVIAGAPVSYGVWLKVNGPGHDKEVSDNEQVDLNQPYRDLFFTGSKAITEG